MILAHPSLTRRVTKSQCRRQKRNFKTRKRGIHWCDLTVQNPSLTRRVMIKSIARERVAAEGVCLSGKGVRPFPDVHFEFEWLTSSPMDFEGPRGGVPRVPFKSHTRRHQPLKFEKKRLFLYPEADRTMLLS